MKKISYIFIFLCSILVFGQNEQLAQNYFDKGEFDKAATLFEEIVKKQSGNSFFVQKLAACYQQLEQFPKAEQLLTEKYNKYNIQAAHNILNGKYHFSKKYS